VTTGRPLIFGPTATDAEVVLRWMAAPNVDMYHVEISKDIDFGDIAVGADTPQTEFRTRLTPGTWYARVAGQAGLIRLDWSVVQEIQVLEVPVAAADLAARDEYRFVPAGRPFPLLTPAIQTRLDADAAAIALPAHVDAWLIGLDTPQLDRYV